MSEQWPDPDDVTCWLASLREGIVAIDRQRATAQEHLETCERAAREAAEAASEEATQRLLFLMHGEVIEPQADDPKTVEAETSGPPRKPLTDDEKQVARQAVEAAHRERDRDELQRRIALAEKHTGVPYEGHRSASCEGQDTP